MSFGINNDDKLIRIYVRIVCVRVICNGSAIKAENESFSMFSYCPDVRFCVRRCVMMFLFTLLLLLQAHGIANE